MKSQQPATRGSGFTLVEVVVTLLVIGILTAGAIYAIGSAKTNSTEKKLTSQVAQLNSAIRVYEANGGSLPGQANIDGVLAKLKSVADEDIRQRINGLRGSVMDNSLVAVMQTDAEAAGNAPRALWNAATQRFEIAGSGPRGAKWFALDADAALSGQGRDDRETTLLLASNSGWVWDYTDFDAPSLDAPDSIDLNEGSEGGEGGPFPDPLPLNPPTFTLAGGDYDYAVFPLTVYLEHDNPESAAHIIYSMGGGNWEPYDGGALTIPPNTTLTTYAVSDDWMHWMDSSQVRQTYHSTFVISGDTEGDFSNPTGGDGMVIGGEGNHFTWGDPAEGYVDPSWVLFNGTEFMDVQAGEQFLLGEIVYYNGTIHSGTGADTVDLAISLAFGGATEILEFNYELELINTPNLEGNTPEESADYVMFGDTFAEFGATLGGVDYTLAVEFGETTEFGFSSLDQFHVIEGAMASGALYGTLLPVDDND